MALLRPTLQGRKGFNPTGYGPGVQSPFGRSPGYFSGTRDHHGQDYFWCKATTAASLGMTQDQSYDIYPVVSGMVNHINDLSLGYGIWQQIDATHRFYTWHMSSRLPAGSYPTAQKVGRMGNSGSSAGADTHAHCEVRRAPYGFADRVDPEPWFRARALEAHQRQVLPTIPVRRRSQPTSKSAEAGEPLEPNEIGNFNGWIRGESVEGNNVWFRGISGHWFWSGGFTSKATSGLADLNPAPAPAVSTRTVRSDIASVRVRTAPTTIASSVREIPAGTSVNVQGYASGEVVEESGAKLGFWYKVSDGWAWAGAFTSRDVIGLTQLPTPESSTPEPVYQLDPTQWKNKTPDIDIAEWVGSPNFNRYATSPEKRHFTEHWMDGTLAGTDTHFQQAGTVTKEGRGTGVASNFGIGQTEVHQYISLKDYQHADGNRDSNTHGVSMEHEGGPTRPITDSVYALSARAHAEVMRTAFWKGGDRLVVGVNMFPHDHWVETDCPGTLDLERLARETNAILHPVVVPDPEPTPEPEPTPLPTPDGSIPDWFMQYAEAQRSILDEFLSDK